MTMSKLEGPADWTTFRDLPLAVEVDFHRADRDGPYLYEDKMVEVWDDALAALKRAHRLGLRYVIFRHGRSTSGPGRTTARSQVRKLISDPASTPYVVRRDCIQHESVFVASLRPNNGAAALPERPPCPVCGATKTKPRAAAGHFRCPSGDYFDWLDTVK